MTILLNFPSVCVTAPAGTGKTQLIVQSILAYTGTKPLLVLTHTNAGIHVLRQRLNNFKYSSNRCQISTIDGFALLLARTFPRRANYSSQNIAIDYANVRTAALTVLVEQHIDSVLVANFARVIVDEYQDCDVVQHQIVSQLARLIPVSVLGDPLQQIFSFNGVTLPLWPDVRKNFETQHELDEPHRWIRAGNRALGQWLLDIREPLLRGETVELSEAPKNSLIHVAVGEDADEKTSYANPLGIISSLDGRILIVGDSTNEVTRRELARRLPGASVVEPVEMKCLLKLAAQVDDAINGEKSACENIQRALIDFSASVMTGINSVALLKRLDSILSGRNKMPAEVHEVAGVAVAESLSYQTVLEFLEALEARDGGRLFRPAMFYAALRTLRMVVVGSALTLSAAAAEYRERRRHSSAPLPRIAVGSTLLLKGLEAENVCINNADTLTAENLYVALTRGSRKVVVRSKTLTLKPKTLKRHN